MIVTVPKVDRVRWTLVPLVGKHYFLFAKFLRWVIYLQLWKNSYWVGVILGTHKGVILWWVFVNIDVNFFQNL